MAYFLFNDLEQRLKTNGLKLSPVSALKELKTCQVSRIEVKGRGTENYRAQRNPVRCTKALGCEETIDKKHVKKVLIKARELM